MYFSIDDIVGLGNRIDENKKQIIRLECEY